MGALIVIAYFKNHHRRNERKIKSKSSEIDTPQKFTILNELGKKITERKWRLKLSGARCDGTCDANDDRMVIKYKHNSENEICNCDASITYCSVNLISSYHETTTN